MVIRFPETIFSGVILKGETGFEGDFGMSVYNGSLAMTRYKVVGPTSRKTIASLSKLILPFTSPPLKVDGPVKSEIIGWVRPLANTDDIAEGTGSHWDMSDCVVGNDYLLRVRYERRKVPQSLAQMLIQQKLKDYAEKNGKNMPRADRQAFKNELLTDLLKRTLPVLQFTDVLWRENASELIIFTASKSARARIEQLFYQTFGEPLDLSLVKIDGALTFLYDDDASEGQLSKRLAKLSKMEPSIFATQSV